VEVDRPEPAPGQVVVKVGGAGACHSDLHIMNEFDADTNRWSPPFTLGHENAGWVEEVGEGVSGFERGQPVAVYGPWGCGRCEHCSLGMEMYCEDLREALAPGGGGGLGVDGGMAEYMLVPDARLLVPLPDGLDPVHAAPLTDAGLTPYHAIRRSLPKLTPRATAVVIGAGGLGHMAVQILAVTTAARIIAVDRRESALALASEHGAHLAFGPDGAARRIREATGGRGADVILDFVGSDATLAMAADAARQTGDLSIVGIGGGTLPVSFLTSRYEVSVQTTYWGSRPELVELLDLAARGLVGSRVTKFSLDRGMDAYRALEAGEIEGRAVVVPHESWSA
jgi:propanol-preferring alcohol dehydrogenase